MATPAFGREKILAWLHEFHSASKTLDADYWLGNFFTENASLQYANSPVISGPSVRQMFKEVFKKLDLMTHEVLYFDFVGDRIYQAAKIRYLVKGDNPDQDVIEVPGFAVCNVEHGEDEKLRCYKAEIFLDPSPVFHRIAEKGL
uniref:SnoaL-like domain-containing protein n=1 Tax=Bionectria ochroleuca TaxID=29856 RepID=A0A8H7KFL2_BIOOC